MRERGAPSLLAFCLSIQLALALLVPGVFFHGRMLFACDAWVFVTLLVLLVSTARLGQRPDRRWLVMVVGVAAVMGLSLAHGYYRAPITGKLLGLGIGVQESDRFNLLHELVIAGRFMSWILEGAWVWWILGQMESDEKAGLRTLIARTLLWIAGAAAVVTILSGLSSGFTNWLSGIYGFQSGLATWRGRAFGPFLSPLEAALTLSLCLLLLLSAVKPEGGFRKSRLSLVAGCLLGGGVLLSHTFTAIGALLITWSGTRFWRLRRQLQALLIFMGVVGLAILFRTGRPLLELKWADLVYRFTPWKVMFETLRRHPGEALLGHGFAPVNVDNGYLFVLFRLGVIGFVALAYLAIRWGRANWARWSLSQREILIFLLVTGLALDTFILRPVVMVFIAAGLPLLYPAGGEFEPREGTLVVGG